MPKTEKELRSIANMILYQLSKRGLIVLAGGQTLKELDITRDEARQVIYEGLQKAVRDADEAAGSNSRPDLSQRDFRRNGQWRAKKC